MSIKGKVKKKYDDGFKRESVELYLNSGRTIEEIANNLGISRSALSRWIVEYRDVRDSTNNSEMVNEDARNHILQLQEENRVLRMERDILKKAARLFANETK